MHKPRLSKKFWINFRRTTWGLLLISGMGYLFANSHADPFFISVISPPYTRLTASGAQIQGEMKDGVYRLTFTDDSRWPLKVQAAGPMGGIATQEISDSNQTKTLTFKNGVISETDSDPQNIAFIPTLCPRLRIVEEDVRLKFIYDAKTDRLNHIPVLQLMKPDAEKNLYETYLRMDGKNVLQVHGIKLSYDYEDASIIEYVGPDAVTGEIRTLKEGYGGFYANINYAVIPYSPQIAALDTQTLLHLAQGSLEKVHKEALKPELRTHAFFPGPFRSSKNYHYELCEWGDTRYQAAVQELEYENMALWDWDYPVQKPDRVLLIVWEGDEEYLYPHYQSLPPHHLIDDMIGVFDIKRADTLQPLTLKNERHDFEITVQTGNMKLHRPALF